MNAVVADEVRAKEGVNPYETCKTCVVREWCGRRSGKVPLPSNYAVNPECSGYIMLERALELSEIPPEYRLASLNTFTIDADNKDQSKKLIAFMQYPVETVEGGENICLFHRNKGTGKTFSACAIANEYIYKACMDPNKFDFENPLALYVEFGDWSNEIRRAHQVHDSTLYEQMYSRIDKMKEVPLLILDDIGSGRITDVIRDLTYDVINRRKVQQLSTIYTSNFVDATLRGEGYLGEMIVSRMLYNSTAILLGGKDRRLT